MPPGFAGVHYLLLTISTATFCVLPPSSSTIVVCTNGDTSHVNLFFFVASLRRICKAIVEAPNDDERLKAFAPIQELLTYVQFANDECDYGMGYELGIDLFCYGSHVREKPLFRDTVISNTYFSHQPRCIIYFMAPWGKKFLLGLVPSPPTYRCRRHSFGASKAELPVQHF